MRCWKKDWVIDLDIRAFFDTIDHALLMKAVERHTDLPWVAMYVRRWLLRLNWRCPVGSDVP
jgi:retron-type reverse transcriptase